MGTINRLLIIVDCVFGFKFGRFRIYTKYLKFVLSGLIFIFGKINRIMLKASELILNSRGAVYHLDMLPEELADTVFFVGDPDRVPKVSKYFDSIESKQQHREFVSHTGYIGNKRYTVLSTGIGPDNIDIVLNELDALTSINLKTREFLPERRILRIIRIGTSGSLQADIPVDSYVVSEFALGTDGVMNYYPFDANEAEKQILTRFLAENNYPSDLAKPYVVAGNDELIRALTVNAHKGITITAPGFYAPQGRQLRVPLKYPNLFDTFQNWKMKNIRVTNFEMETSMIYGLSSLFGHKACSISAIVANRANGTFSTQSDITIDNLIRYTLEIVHNS